MADVLCLDPCNSVYIFQNFISNYFWSKIFFSISILNLETLAFIKYYVSMILSRRGDTLYNSMTRKYHTDMTLSRLYADMICLQLLWGQNFCLGTTGCFLVLSKVIWFKKRLINYLRRVTFFHWNLTILCAKTCICFWKNIESVTIFSKGNK